jgi:hypothetical protein
MTVKNIIFLVSLFSFQLICAQDLNQIGVFPTIDHSGTLTDKLEYSLYYFGAFNIKNSAINGSLPPANLSFVYAEQALTYSLSSNLSFTGSYVFEKVNPTKDNFRNENRFYLQMGYQYNLNRTTLKHRLRFDGRFIQDRVTGDRPFTSRLRYKIGLETPLQKNNKVYLSLYNEFFFNLDKSAIAIYGEDWAYAAIGFKIDKNNKIEAGPLSIFGVYNKQNDFNRSYYLQLTWINHLDFRATKKI